MSDLSHKPGRAAIDAAIHDIDRRLADILGAILHHPAVQRLESLWRGLHRLLAHTRPHENIRVDLLIVAKQSLHDDFQRAGDPALAGLHHLVYTRAYASHGGQPYGLLCAAYDFGPDPEDLALLKSCAAVANLAHAPFLADAAPALLGLRSHADIPRLRDLPAAQAGPRFAAWHAFRATPEARSVALCAPRFLLRAPYSPATEPTQPLPFRELIDRPTDLLWGHACLLVAMRAAESFAEQRWCLGLVGTLTGPQLLGLAHPHPTHATLEVSLPPRSERALADAGLLALTLDRASGRAILREAPTLHHSPDADLGAQLPYVLLIGRLAHYLQRVQRERVGQWDDRNALQRELDLWLRQYVADMDDPPADVRARKPLRRASITLAGQPDQPGWHRCHLRIVPHLTHLGRPLTLELIGRLDLGPR